MRSANEILDKIIGIKGLKNDAALARQFKVKSNTVTNWRKRNSVPYDYIVPLCEEEGWSLNWLLTGQIETKYIETDQEKGHIAATKPQPVIGTLATGSEVENTGFLSRLTNLIGDKKPFHWAAEVGISKGAFDRIWNKGSVPSSELLVRIHNATGVSIDWLLTGKGPRSGLEVLFQAAPAPVSEKIQPVFEAFMEVMTSEEKGTVLALTQNTYEFRDKVRLQKEMANMKKDMDAIKRRLFDEPREADFKTQGTPGESEHPESKHHAGGK